MNIKKLKLAITQAQKVCNEMNKCVNKFILQDSINEIEEIINYTRSCTDLCDCEEPFIEVTAEECGGCGMLIKGNN